MVKKQKNAPPVTPEPTSEAVIEPEKPAPQPEIPFSIDPKLAAQAEQFGIPVKQLVDWAASMEEFKKVTMANFAIIEKAMTDLEPLVKLSNQVVQAQAQLQPTTAPQAPPMAGLGSLLQFLPQILGSGGGDSRLQELAMKSLEADISLSHTIKNAVSTRILAPITKEVAEAASPG